MFAGTYIATWAGAAESADIMESGRCSEYDTDTNVCFHTNTDGYTYPNVNTYTIPTPNTDEYVTLKVEITTLYPSLNIDCR